MAAFSRRTDTGGYRNQCMRCRNGDVGAARCAGCGKSFTRRPPVTKPCKRCGAQFVGSMEQRRYCSVECRAAAIDEQRREARRGVRLEALRAYGGASPACACCGEDGLLFLSLDHVAGEGRKHRQETGGGGFYSWLRRHGYPAGFQVLCHNCNLGRHLNGGDCPHQTT